MSTDELLAEPVLSRLRRAYAFMRAAREVLVQGQLEYIATLDGDALREGMRNAVEILDTALPPTRARLVCRVCGKPLSEHANPQFGTCMEPAAPQ